MIWEALTIALFSLLLFWIIINKKDKKYLNKLKENYNNENRQPGTEPTGEELPDIEEPARDGIYPEEL